MKYNKKKIKHKSKKIILFIVAVILLATILKQKLFFGASLPDDLNSNINVVTKTPEGYNVVVDYGKCVEIKILIVEQGCEQKQEVKK